MPVNVVQIFGIKPILGKSLSGILWLKTPFPMCPLSRSYHYFDMKGWGSEGSSQVVGKTLQVRPEHYRNSKLRMKSAKADFATSLKVRLLGNSSRDCRRALCRLVALCFFTWKSLYKAALWSSALGIAENRDLDISLGAELCIFNMAAYTLPEGFTDFDMFTFGTALLVGGKWAPGEIAVQRLK